MIYYSLVVRARDGLVLSGSTDADTLREVKDTKRYLKMLSKKVSQFPDRCSLHLDFLVIHFITTLGVSYLALTEKSYPTVLAFSFLDELMKEFIVLYNTHAINRAIRPYSFLEFDSFIQKLRQRYNNPRSLTTKVNLSDLSTEIKLRPAHLLALRHIEPVTNSGANGLEHNMVGPTRLEPVSWLGLAASSVCGFCILFNIVRGLTVLSTSNLEVQEYEGSNVTNGIAFLLEAVFQCMQVKLLLQYNRRRYFYTCIFFVSICTCNMFVWDVRDLWQILVHVGVAAALTFCIIQRRFEHKAPNFNV